VAIKVTMYIGIKMSEQYWYWVWQPNKISPSTQYYPKSPWY